MSFGIQPGGSNTLKFEKWEGTGNDFIICSEIKIGNCGQDFAEIARKACRRNFGVGADGLVLIGKSECADFRMRMWNPDGSESEMCGNGLRCVGGHLLDHGLVDGSQLVKIETIGRTATISFLRPPEWEKSDEPWVKVDMGVPVLDRASIPICSAGPSPVVEEELRVPGYDAVVRFTGVNFGNPHAVIFVENVDEIPLEKWGPAIENCGDVFPNRVNVEFAQIIDNCHVKMRVWERGAGATLSCGSGIAAIQAACHITGKAGDKLRIDVPGGSLITEYTESGSVALAGPAVRVFNGELLICNEPVPAKQK